MTLMHYDAGAFGNHELDDGPAWWLRARRAAAFPILTANVFVTADSGWAASLAPVDRTLLKGARWIGGEKVHDSARLRHITTPYLIQDVGGLKVAILGLTTKDIVAIVSRERNQGVAVGDPITVARALVPELRKKADVVVALTHLGVRFGLPLAALRHGGSLSVEPATRAAASRGDQARQDRQGDLLGRSRPQVEPDGGPEPSDVLVAEPQLAEPFDVASHVPGAPHHADEPCG